MLLVHAPVVHALGGYWSALGDLPAEQEAESEHDADSEAPSPEIEDTDVQDDVALVLGIHPAPRELSSLQGADPQLVRQAPLRAPFLDPEVPPPRR